jgi:hypothetical protein
MDITRRQTMLTLARLEWDAIVHELESTPQVAEASTPAVAALRRQLEGCTSDPEAMVTIAQPPLNWSPLIVALSLNVLQKPDLLPVAERLRDQMFVQARHGADSLAGVDQSTGLRRWELSQRELGRKHANPN